MRDKSDRAMDGKVLLFYTLLKMSLMTNKNILEKKVRWDMKELVTLTVNEHGHLVISKIDGYEEEYADIDAMDISDDSKFGEVLEYHVCNGWGYSSDCSQYGHLSNAPIIWDCDYELTDDETGEVVSVRQFWYDNNYAIRSAWEVFMRDGEVTFYFFNTEE